MMFFITTQGLTFLPKLLNALYKEGINLEQDYHEAEKLDNMSNNINARENNKEENGWVV